MAHSFEMPRSRVYIDSYEVDARLKRLSGLTRVPLVEAVLRGDNARRNTGPLELPSSPSFNAVSKGVEALREETIALGWHPSRFLNIEVAMNNDETIAITVTEGDEFTGVRAERDPHTVALKGPNTTKAADDNRLFEEPPVSLWYLLTRSVEEGLFAELSSPSAGNDGVIIGWNERILLGNVSAPSGVGLAVPSQRISPSEQAIVNVVRRQA